MSQSVQRVEYTGALWRAGEIHPALHELLYARNCLIVLQHGPAPYRVTFGVPHQASAGAGEICDHCPQEAGGPRKADENAAYYALGAFSTLRDLGLPCRLVIMAHPTGCDPNKDPASPYCRELFAADTALLFECHGSGPTRRHELELSAGRNPLHSALQFGRRLAAALEYRYLLAAQKEPGHSAARVLTGPGEEQDGRLQFPANRTASLILAYQKQIPALHLEAKARFRTPIDRAPSLTPDGKFLGARLAQTIVALELME